MRSGGRLLIGAGFVVAGVAVTAGLTLTPASAATNHRPGRSAATQPAGGGWAATDVLGQTKAGQPSFTTNGEWNNTNTPHGNGFGYNQGTALDTVHHRLFAGDCGGDRVDVFLLNSANQLVSHAPNNELGQANFTTDTNGLTAQNRLSCPDGPSYDPVHDRLFVPEYDNSRVLVFDLASGITNGMNASYVLGQSTFTTKTQSTSQSGMDNPYGGSAYDSAHQRLFVSDSANRRVLVWDLSGGITNGMNATYVLGQQTFLTRLCVASQSGMGYPYGMAFDAIRHFLFVADDVYSSTSACAAGRPHRVLVYDLSHGISNGMNASYVLGEPDFTTTTTMSDRKAAIDDPEDLAYDPLHERLFVQDDYENRTTVFDVATIHNGMEARAVMGYADFNGNANGSYTCNNPTATNQ